MLRDDLSAASRPSASANAQKASQLQGERALQELVAVALDSEDVMPLVRVVFENHETQPVSRAKRSDESIKSWVNAPQGSQGGEEALPRLRSAGSKQQLEGPGAIAIEALQNVVTQQEKEIERLCSVHYADIARCSQDIEHMANPVFRLRETLYEGNRALQDAGSGLLSRLKEVQELSLVKERIQDAEVAVESCTKALELCDKAWSTVEAGHLHQALILAQGISRMANRGDPDGLNCSGEALNTSSSSANAGNGIEAIAPGAPAAGLPLERDEYCDLRLLRPFIAAQAVEIASAVEQQVLEDFKTWLVEVRSKATDFGQKAIRMAAQQRQKVDEMRVEARAVQAALLESRDPWTAVTLCHQGSQASSQHSSRVGEGNESMRSLLDGLDMLPLYSAHHIYMTLDKAAWFRTTYLDNRRHQMTTDLTLTPSQPFVDIYQSYLNQVVGFFLIEDRVLRTSGGITTPAGVDSLWETALGQIKDALIGTYDRISDPNALLLVKDFVHLVCRALSACSFRVKPIEEVLSSGLNQYHDLLMQQAVQECAALLRADDLGGSTMKISAEAHLVVVREASLPWDLSTNENGNPNPPSDDYMPKLPFSAPFTPAIPKLIRLIKRTIADSMAYLRGIMGPGEFLPVLRQFRDKLFSKAISEQMALRLTATSSSRTASVGEALQLAANTWSMNGSALVALEEYIVGLARGDHDTHYGRADVIGSWSARAGNAGRSIVSGSEASAALDALQKSAITHAMAVMAEQLDSLIASAATTLSWMPDANTNGNSSRCSAYMQKSVMYLQEHLQTAAQLLPRPAACKLQKATVEHFAKSLMGILQGPKIPKFNIHSIQRLDVDLQEAEDFATCLSMGGNDDLQDAFSTLRGIVKLMLTNEVEILLQDGLNSKTYGPLLLSSSPQMLSVADVLDKYRETSSGLLMSRGGKQVEQPRRRELDRLVKFLRDAANGLVNTTAT